MIFPPTTLGIDYGTRRIGLAISRASLVEPLTVIHIPQKVTTDAHVPGQLQKESFDFVLTQLKKIIEEEGVKQLVVGVSEGAMEQASRIFGNELSTYFKLPVYFVDETLTSQVVEQKMREVRKSFIFRPTHGKSSQKALDHYAAAEILEAFFDLND